MTICDNDVNAICKCCKQCHVTKNRHPKISGTVTKVVHKALVLRLYQNNSYGLTTWYSLHSLKTRHCNKQETLNKINEIKIAITKEDPNKKKKSCSCSC